MNTIDEIKQRLKILAPSHVELIDDSHLHQHHAGNTGGGHYRLLIVSDCFQNLSRLERQRVVQQQLQEMFGSLIHALSIRALTKQEYQHTSLS
ncbi:BolA family transcriptional regulator [Neisseriaceae bacterium ESL0693]|nr:BolA family transcriptional regulator [Neisseriaceae bacterium ESL0693]